MKATIGAGLRCPSSLMAIRHGKHRGVTGRKELAQLARRVEGCGRERLALALLGALLAGVGLALGPWKEVFGFTALPTGLIATIVAIACVYLFAANGAKRLALSDP